MQRDTSAGLPTRAALHPSGLYLVLKDIAVSELQDPFMYQTVARSSAPEKIVHIEPDKVGEADSATAPRGIIFHVGRCGSTVLSQALKQLDDVAVYSEPLPINELLSPPSGSRREVTQALRSLGAAFAAHAGAPYVLKLSSWNTLFADVIADAFPQSPWLFCVRDPVEVGAALLHTPPPWLRGDSAAARHIASIVGAAADATAEEVFARFYASLCDTIMRLDPARGRLLRYEQLLQMLASDAPAHFRLHVDEAGAQRMHASTARYAKAPLDRPAPFAPDAEAKQAAATPALRRAVDTLARPALERVIATLERR